MSDDFRAEIDRLAEVAREEMRQRDEEAAARARRRRQLSPLIWIGTALIAFEMVSLGLLTYMHRREIAAHPAVRPSQLISQNDCRGAMYRTWRAIVGFRRAGGRIPQNLGELVPIYVESVPVDPTTRLPLVYAADGERFTLGCSPAPALKPRPAG